MLPLQPIRLDNRQDNRLEETHRRIRQTLAQRLDGKAPRKNSEKHTRMSEWMPLEGRVPRLYVLKLPHPQRAAIAEIRDTRREGRGTAHLDSSSLWQRLLLTSKASRAPRKSICS